MKSFLIVFTLLFAVACSSDDDSNNSDDSQDLNQFDSIVTDLPEGTWEIESFINQENDNTIVFETYVFDFNEDGTVAAVTDLLSAAGAWSYTGRLNSDIEYFNLSFTNSNPTEPFDQLTENWEIVSATSTRLEVKVDEVDVMKTLVLTKI